MFKVSVIMPVYNASRFVNQAVDSAVALEEVGEVILIEDNSPDDSLEKCKEIVSRQPKVKLYRHPDGKNHGAGASRNLGILKASCDFISFLDADDYYLPNRFTYCKQVFMADPSVDFIFGASQYNDDYEKKSDRIRQLKANNKDSLFYQLLDGRRGDFDTNAITVRRNSLLKIELFKTELRLHQDTELWLRMAYYLKGHASPEPEPIAIARKHDANRITQTTYQSRLQMWTIVRDEFKDKPNIAKEKILINSNYRYYKKSAAKGNVKIQWLRRVVVARLVHEYNKIARLF